MEKSYVAKALARGLVFAAWADGRVTVEERNFLREAFEKLEGLQEEDRKLCMEMLNHKPLQSEALVAFKQLRHATVIESDREYVMATIRELMDADGVTCSDEADFIQGVDRIINGDEEAFYAEMSRLLKELSF